MKREAFLARVRDALHRSEDDPVAVPPSPRTPAGERSKGDVVDVFLAEATAAGWNAHRVDDVASAAGVVGRLLEAIENGDRRLQPQVQSPVELIWQRLFDVAADLASVIAGTEVSGNDDLVLETLTPLLMHLLPLVIVISVQIGAPLVVSLRRNGDETGQQAKLD